MKADLTRFGLPEAMLTKSINELSGEKQRVSLIRNLQFMPRVLLLDEITSALDEENKRNVNEIVHQLVAEHRLAVLWVTHDTEEIAHADEVITLRAHGAEQQNNRSNSMNQHNITSESLGLSMITVVVAIPDQPPGKAGVGKGHYLEHLPRGGAADHRRLRAEVYFRHG